MIQGTPLPASAIPQPAGSPRAAGAGTNLLPFDPLSGATTASAATLPVVPPPLPEAGTSQSASPQGGLLPGAPQTTMPQPQLQPQPQPPAPHARSESESRPSPPPAITGETDARHPSPAGACFPVSFTVVPNGADAVVELHVEHAGGRVEVLSLPWRLAPSGTLSQRYDGGVPPPWRPPGPYAQQAAVAVKAWNAAGQAMASPLPAEAAAADPATAGLRAPPATVRIHHAMADATDDDPSSAAFRAAPQAQPWLERLYRWAERAGLDPSLWIRDYRLDATQARDLAATLQSLARERGVTLRRIVVNGREAWHAAATDSAPTHRNRED